VSRWETGTYKPTPEDLDKLARFFSVPITVFFPELQGKDANVAALASALGGLSKKDIDEVVRYAEFRKARRAMEAGKRKRTKP
jgi:transcriptional regulator with XRE-family HTH domain